MASKNIKDIISARNTNQREVNKAYDEMFGLSETAFSMAIKEIEISKISLFPDDPFKEYSESEQLELAQSIKDNGLLEPVILRPDSDGKNGLYQMLSGRHRLNAFIMNKMPKIPAIIKDVDDDEAIMIVTETNLKRRKKLYPSEKGKAYRMQLEAIKRQGYRSDLADSDASAQLERKTSREIIAEKNNIDRNEIQRYIRLTYLIKELLELVDDKILPIHAGVELSYLSEESQSAVFQFFFDDGSNKKLSLKESKIIREYFEKHKSLTAQELEKLLNSPTKTKKLKPFTINRKILSKYKEIPDDKELVKLFTEFLDRHYDIL